ncbi:securin-like isoform X1 [Thalassophryne amazonica]|uniref:securin-like isoform X1 n=1 Tax=Thalassophryne amazonica TaxID=390379 RepID=UPI001470F1B4|nr:securin-like isoform X1 [Thalassophryne amazonica]
MSTVNFEQEKFLQTPSLKMRQRLQSAPDKLLKTPTTKNINTPLPSGRKVLGTVNKISTPAPNAQEKKLQKVQEAKVKCAPQTKVEEYPDIEKFIPYDPLEFEKYSIPEDLIRLGSLGLPGLACIPQLPCLGEKDLEVVSPLPFPSPVKMTKHPDYCLELDAFLQTLSELTVELPPESETD